MVTRNCMIYPKNGFRAQKRTKRSSHNTPWYQHIQGQFCWHGWSQRKFPSASEHHTSLPSWWFLGCCLAQLLRKVRCRHQIEVIEVIEETFGIIAPCLIRFSEPDFTLSSKQDHHIINVSICSNWTSFSFQNIHIYTSLLSHALHKIVCTK